MTSTSKVPAALLAAAALFAAGCNSDDAVKKDVKNATEEAGKELDEAGKDAEKAIPGDADDDGK